jgi:hypothetical protein
MIKLQGNGQITYTNPSRFMLVTFKISPACVFTVYQLGYFQGYPQCPGGLPPMFYLKYILSFHTMNPPGKLQSYFRSTSQISPV